MLRMFLFASMMIVFSRSQRLQGKEVRYLTRKRQIVNRGIFTIFHTEQYPNRAYHQLSFHIPLLISKRAVCRHKIKRILIKSCQTALQQVASHTGNYAKCFVTLHKAKLQELQHYVQQKDRASLENYLDHQMQSAFIPFLQHYASQHSFKNHSQNHSSKKRSSCSHSTHSSSRRQCNTRSE